LNIGTSAATLVTSGTGISEALGVGASLITSFSFPDFIKALQSQGTTSILSNPKISVMNGQPALISVGKNVTYIDSVEAKVSDTGQVAYTISTDSVLSGIGLALSAVVKRDNEIIMNLVQITSELTEPIEYKDFGLGTVGLPVVNMREMNTTVKIKDGSMLVVGGLISELEETEGENFLPGTEDIPVLKYLFGYEEKRKIKRELIILLKPRIIN
jgi:general secretion pathway protein D/MSHA biogenesis protein MshL